MTHDDLQANLLAGYDATGGGSAGAFVYNNGWGNDVNNSHGTAVAGIIGAIKDNNKGISGVAPGCKIIPIRVMIDGYAQDSWAVAAFNWARTRADVINCSWGGTQANAQLTSAINNAAMQGRNNGTGAKGCVVVFATGNDDSSQINYQAALPNVIGVGAVSLNSRRKSLSSPDGEQWGSNYGTGIDFVAPGVLIPTTDIQEFHGYNWDWDIHPDLGGNKRTSDYYPNRNYTVWFSGTSAAAPQVAGIAALILSKNPNLLARQVSYVISKSASNSFWNDQTGNGLVDAYAALSMVGDGTPLQGGRITPSLTNSLFPQGGSSLYEYQWQVSFTDGLWHNIPGSTDHELSVNSGELVDNTKFRRRVNSGSETAYSNVVIIYGYGNMDSGVPLHDNHTTGTGSYVPLYLSPAPPSYLTLQWEKSVDGINWELAPNSFSVPNYMASHVLQTTHYRVKISNGLYSPTLGYSNTVTITVN